MMRSENPYQRDSEDPVGKKIATPKSFGWRKGEIKTAKQVAAMMGWPDRTAYDTLKELESRGLILRCESLNQPGLEQRAPDPIGDASWIMP